MDNQIPQNILDDLVSLSETMVASAAEADWEQLAHMDKQRRQFLEQLSEHGHAFDPGRFVLASQKLSELDQQLQQIVRGARDSAAKQHKTLKQNQTAVANYRMVENPAA